MNPFWENLFYDKLKLNQSDSEFAEIAGDELKSALDDIKSEINDLELKEAIKLIEHLQSEL